MTYDKANRLVSEEQRGSDGSVRITRHEYDAKHNRTLTIDFRGNKTAYVYDPFGHILKESNPSQTYFYGYDSAGNEISRTDANENTTTSSYNAYGNPLETRHPDGTVEKFNSYSDGSLKSAVNQEGTITSYSYDP